MDEKRWLQHYDKGVPPTLQPYPGRTLVDMVVETARQRPGHTALYFKGRAMSYGQLEQLSASFASALISLGVQKGQRIALLMPNTPQLVFCLIGAWQAGGIAVPINPLYTERELAFAFQESGAETVVVLSRFYPKVKAVQARTGIHRVIVTSISEYLPPFIRILYRLLREKKEGDHIHLRPGDLRLSDMLRRPGGMPLPPGAVQPDDPAILLFSGGTTGKPKAVIGVHRSLLISGMQLHVWFGNTMQDWTDVILLNMPLFHVYGLAGVFSTGLVGRQPLAVVPNPRDLNDVLDTITKTRPAFLAGVPTMFNSLLNHPKVRSGRADLTSIKVSISGAAPLLLEIKQHFEKLTGGRIIEGYSMTESMMAAVMTPVQGQYKPGAVGVPLPDVELRIMDAEAGSKELSPGQVGEIVIRAPQTMQGYWKKPAETAEALRDGWLVTGDLGYLDEDGFLFIVDRKKDVIKPGGFQVWPREVEEVLAAHPAVAEVCVAGVPDPHQGEAVKAWVVLRPGHTLTADTLHEFCHGNLAAYKVPRHFQFMDSLPKSGVGKILRRELVAKEKTN